MNPAEFVERAPRYTAVQWDGSEESAAWITENLRGTQRDGDDLTIRDALDRITALPRDTWVVLQEGSMTPLRYDPATFDRMFAAA